ncbi:hypothetical protein SADFL11_00049500 [Roseibium alexandrii DFL-11]|uniref:Uncharacterized protein n=1 Tax=Roseibium alexandrii (strain DSM 17067 / NCIMB 14079 / DFL-11) TaxID=244592 RepID=A0A5E8UXV0_ROSAD|nr:hypothetical protein SADFL11_00049500 [Roseibium alexandrii DFL-11]
MNRELNRLIWKDRAKTIAAVIGVLLAVIAFFMLIFSLMFPVSLRDTEKVEGVVIHHSKHQSNMGPGAVILRIRLVDGQEVSVTTKRKRTPKIGDRIQLSQHKNIWGHSFYMISRVLRASSAKTAIE